MMTLYFSPGACSLASHIGLEETGAPYEIKPILLAKGQQRIDAYLKINPRVSTAWMKSKFQPRHLRHPHPPVF